MFCPYGHPIMCGMAVITSHYMEIISQFVLCAEAFFVVKFAVKFEWSIEIKVIAFTNV